MTRSFQREERQADIISSNSSLAVTFAASPSTTASGRCSSPGEIIRRGDARRHPSWVVRDRAYRTRRGGFIHHASMIPGDLTDPLARPCGSSTPQSSWSEAVAAMDIVGLGLSTLDVLLR
jgi:hypothetical protein